MPLPILVLWKKKCILLKLKVSTSLEKMLIHCTLQEFKKHHILNEMAGLRISRSKKVTFDIKVTIEISCLMDFSDYPFDEHTCNFQVIKIVSCL